MWDTPETPLPYNLVSTIVISLLGDAAGARRRAAGRLLHRAAPASRPRRSSCCSCWSPRCCSRRCSPPGCSASSWRWGINDTWLAMILVNAAFNLSFARVDDALASSPRCRRRSRRRPRSTAPSRLQTLRTVTLPLVWPGIVTAIIFTFVACWNEFAASPGHPDHRREPAAVGGADQVRRPVRPRRGSTSSASRSSASCPWSSCSRSSSAGWSPD